MAYTGDKIALINVDDTNICFYWLKNNPTASSCFDEPFLGWLKTLHDTYGCVVTCPVFYVCETDNITTLSEVPDTWKAEFEANSSWLHFVFHSYSRFTGYADPAVGTNWSFGGEIDFTRNMTDDYMLAKSEITRICGASSWQDDAVTMHFILGRKIDMLSIASATGGNKLWIGYPRSIQEYYPYDYYFLASVHPEVRADIDSKGYYYDTTTGNLFIIGAYYPDYETWFPLIVEAIPVEGRNVLICTTHERFVEPENQQIRDKIAGMAVWANANGYVWQFPTYDYVVAAYGLNSPFSFTLNGKNGATYNINTKPA